MIEELKEIEDLIRMKTNILAEIPTKIKKQKT
jgi:hypothetical protein